MIFYKVHKCFLLKKEAKIKIIFGEIVFGELSLTVSEEIMKT